MNGALLVFDTRIRTTSTDNQLQQISEVPFSRALMQRIIVFHDATRGLVYHRLHAGWGMYDHGTVKHEPNGTLTFLSSEPPTGYFGDLRRVQWNLVGDTLEVRGAPAGGHNSLLPKTTFVGRSPPSVCCSSPSDLVPVPGIRRHCYLGWIGLTTWPRHLV